MADDGKAIDNLDWVCAAMRAAALHSRSEWKDEQAEKLMRYADAIRAEFAELRKKADAFDKWHRWMMANESAARRLGREKEHAVFRECLIAVQEIYSMTKGENDDQG